MDEHSENGKGRGARGEKKHTPGRGHTRKSWPAKLKRFQKKARRQQEEAEADLRRQWDDWDRLPLEVQRLRPELKPRSPRPTYED